MIDQIKEKELFILDMDGTIYLDENLIDGALDFLQVLKKHHKKFMFFTNNSSKAQKDYMEKLDRLGISITEEQFYSSGDVTMQYIKTHYPNQSVYLIGTEQLKKGFQRNDIPLNDQNPDLIVLGFDTELTYDKIYKGCTWIREGKPFIATHPDVNCPVKNGLMPDCGAMIEMFKASTGKEPIIMGKPNHHTLEAIELKTGVDRSKMVFVGDRLETDIAIGINHKVKALLVLTGATTRKQLERSLIQPSMVFDSVREIKDIF